MKFPKDPNKLWRGVFAGNHYGDLWQTYNIDLEKKLGEMGKQTNAKYLHIIEYQNGEITRDLEGGI